MGEYVPFIEAVSASEYKYSSTFGFIHFMGMDETGEAYGAEYPIMMHDSRLLDLQNPTINEVLGLVDSFYGNHDLWHNMLPVYADHFILHHAHAPLSYGGRLPNYTQFGKQLRSEKEEYEIGVAMSHARTQQERFRNDPGAYEQQTSLILDALDKIPSLRQELQAKCSPEEIEDIVDYLASTAAKEVYNVLPADDPIFSVIEEKLEAIGIPSLPVSSSEVAILLWKQGLLDKATIRSSLGADISDDEILAVLQGNSDAARQSLRSIDLNQDDKESGAEHIVAALETQGVLPQVIDNDEVHINGMGKIRWLAMVAPQREQLKGHMEKVHGKPGYIFGEAVVQDARDLVLLQHEAIKKDEAHYIYREQARSQNQRLSYNIYSLLFEDGQKMFGDERAYMSILRQDTENAALRISTKEAVECLDNIMDALVSCRYDVQAEKLSFLDSFSIMLGHMNTAAASRLSIALQSIAKNYRELRENENGYQGQINATYIDAAKHLLDEQMTII